MQLQYLLSLSGAPTAASLTINLPSGFTIDTSKLTSGTDTSNRSLGNVSFLIADKAIGTLGYNSTSSIAIYTTQVDTTPYLYDNQVVDATHPTTWANGHKIYIANLFLPISGWTSTKG
jgi:hypothetical protein